MYLDIAHLILDGDKWPCGLIGDTWATHVSLDKQKDGGHVGLFTNKADDVLGAVYIGMYNYYVLGYLNTNQTLKLINIPQIIIAKPKKT